MKQIITYNFFFLLFFNELSLNNPCFLLLFFLEIYLPFLFAIPASSQLCETSTGHRKNI